MDSLDEFEKVIGYKFKNIQYLKTALSHSSFANEHHIENNERLEFLGDSVLSLIVSEKLFEIYKQDNEGDLSKIRASLVCENALFELSKKIKLADYINLGNGEEIMGGRKRPSIVSDAFEALLAAVFSDSDFETAKKWLLNLMEEEIEAAQMKPSTDYKTMIQELTQKKGKGKVTYELLEEKGPDHDKQFVYAVLVDGNKIAEGKGRSKKQAEQNAAKNAMEKL